MWGKALKSLLGMVSKAIRGLVLTESCGASTFDRLTVTYFQWSGCPLAPTRWTWRKSHFLDARSPKHSLPQIIKPGATVGTGWFCGGDFVYCAGRFLWGRSGGSPKCGATFNLKAVHLTSCHYNVTRGGRKYVFTALCFS